MDGSVVSAGFYVSATSRVPSEVNMFVMARLSFFSIIAATFVGCNPTEPSQYYLDSSDFRIVDAFFDPWRMDEDSGAVLLHRNRFIDSVSLSYRPIVIGQDSIVYRKYDDMHYYFFDGDHKVSLDGSLPMFHWAFSVPKLFDNKLYYWGYRLPEIFVLRYDLQSAAVDSLLITYDPIQMGMPPYYYPLERDDLVYFFYKDSVAVVDRNFNLVDKGEFEQLWNTDRE